MNLKNNERTELETLLAEARADFEHVLQTAIAAKNLSAESKIDACGAIADTLLLRCIITGVSIYQLLHPQPVGNLRLVSFPDWPSIASLSRTICEAYLALFSIAILPKTSGERELRLLWWKWHEVNERVRTRDLIGSKRPEAIQFDSRLAQLKRQVMMHSDYGRIPQDLRKKFDDGKRPYRALLETPRQIAKKAGILEEQFEVHYQFLSDAAHSQPLVVGMLRKHEPDAVEMLRPLKQSVNFATSYLALAVRDFARIAPKANEVFDVRFQKIVATWEGVYATSLKSVSC